jgi:hypothetical protein
MGPRKSPIAVFKPEENRRGNKGGEPLFAYLCIANATALKWGLRSGSTSRANVVYEFRR